MLNKIKERLFGFPLILGIILFAGLTTLKQDNPGDNFPLYQSIRGIELQKSGVRISGITLEKDAAKIHFIDGDLWFFTPVEGKILGAVFTGRGEITLNPAIDSEKAFLAQLTEKAPFVETFKGLTLLFSDSPFQPFQDQLQTPSEPPDNKALNRAADSWKLFRKGKKYAKPNPIGFFFPWNVHARLLFDLLNPPEEKSFFLANGDGGKYGEFVYLEDPLGVPGHEPEEVALLNLSEKNLGSWYSAHFRSHYQNGRPRNPHPRKLIEVERYWIGARLEGRTLAAVTSMHFTSLRKGLSILPLNLDPGLRLSQVTDNKSKSVSFIQEKFKEDGNLSVIFPEPLEKGERCVLTFTYAGNNTIIDRGNGNFSLLNRSGWYPNPGMGKYRAKFVMNFDIPEKTQLLATGKKISERREGNRLQVSWVSDIPLKVAGFNYGVFESKESVDKTSGYRIETFANKELPNELAQLQLLAGQIQDLGELNLLGSLNTVEMMEKVHAEARAAAGIYSSCFGALPYERVAITQQPFYDFGQAWPTLIYMPLTVFLPSIHKEIMRMNDGFYTQSFYRLVCAHEVAHQWWGHWIGWSNYRDQWLSEGLAVFSSSLFAQQVYGPDYMNKFWDELKDQLIKKNRLGVRPVEMGALDMGYRLDTGKTGASSHAVVYGKGGYILHMLRMMMWNAEDGDSRFLNMLKDLVATQANGFLTCEGFQAQVEKFMTPQMNVRGDNKMDWFFDQWVHGTQVPRYALDYKLSRNNEGKTVVTLKIRQSRVSDDFIMIVPVYVQFGDKTGRLGQVRILGNTETSPLTVALPKKPKKLLLCAMHDILCELE